MILLSEKNGAGWKDYVKRKGNAALEKKVMLTGKIMLAKIVPIVDSIPV